MHVAQATDHPKEKHSDMKWPLTALALVLLVGCDNKAELKQTATAEVASSAAATPAVEGATLDDVAQAYEAMRKSLAEDKLSAVPAEATALAGKARGVARTDEDHTAVLTQLATEAEALANVAGDDPNSLRLGFGNVSKQFVALVETVPALKGKLHVFKCPMAAGYKKWVQQSAKLENPYMGQKMLECGSEVDWQ